VTGLVYAVIIALWVVVLVPLWLRRHDESRGRQTAEQYNQAMNTLARAARSRPKPSGHSTAAGADQPNGAEAAEPDAADVTPGWGLGDVVSVVRSVVPFTRGARATLSRPARRRRTIVMILLGGLAASVAGALVGVVPGLLAVVFVFLLAGYLMLAARMGRGLGAASAARDRSAETERIRTATEEARRVASGATVDVDEVLAGNSSTVRIVPGQNWEPQEAALPTYVGKQRASKVPRVLDLRAPDREWSGAAMVEQAQAAQAEAQAPSGEKRAARQRAAEEQFEREMDAVKPKRDEHVGDLANPDSGPADPMPYRRAANQ